jgi:hypothetical protein
MKEYLNYVEFKLVEAILDDDMDSVLDEIVESESLNEVNFGKVLSKVAKGASKMRNKVKFATAHSKATYILGRKIDFIKLANVRKSNEIKAYAKKKIAMMAKSGDKEGIAKFRTMVDTKLKQLNATSQKNIDVIKKKVKEIKNTDAARRMEPVKKDMSTAKKVAAGAAIGATGVAAAVAASKAGKKKE